MANLTGLAIVFSAARAPSLGASAYKFGIIAPQPPSFSNRAAAPSSMILSGISSGFWAGLSLSTLTLCTLPFLSPPTAGGQTLRTRAAHTVLVVLALVAMLNYLRLPPVQDLADRPVHVHDLTHYYLGAKYFPELGYDRLYVCFLEATQNDFGATQARDLRDRQVKSVAEILGDGPERCSTHFSAARWTQFAGDARRMRRWAAPEEWRRFVLDSGFNAPPTWLIAGHWLAERVDLSLTGVYVLTLLDPVLLLVGISALAASFGLPVAALAVLGTTTLAAAAPVWTIGSLLRWDWLCWLMLALAAARRDWMFRSGLAFGFATALRIFPVAACVVLAGYAVLRHRRGLSLAPLVRWAAGLAAGGLGLSALSLLVVTPADWSAFLTNLARHSQIYSVNFMGLRTSLTLVWSLLSAGETYPSELTLVALKGQAYAKIAWIHGLIALGSLALLRRIAPLPLWASLALALAWIPFSWNELSSYYYMFWGCLFVLAHRHPPAVAPLVAGNVASWVLLRWLGETPHYYAALSAAFCLALLLSFALLDRALRTRKDADTKAEAAPPN